MSSYWEINGTQTDGLTGAQNGLASGNSPEFEFSFFPRGSGTGHIDRYKAVRPITGSAGRFKTYETLTHEWHFRDDTSGTSQTSPLVHIVPPDASQIAREVWGLVEDFDDGTVSPEHRCTLSLTVKLLHIGSGYASESEFRDAREVAGL